MLLIEDDKLEEMVRKALKEELEAILIRIVKTISGTIDVGVKKEAETKQPEPEAFLLEIEDIPFTGKTILPQKDTVLSRRDTKSPLESKLLYGIKGLAEFLECSLPLAAKLKNQGHFPFTKVGNKIIFHSEDVINAVQVEKQRSNP